MINARKNYEKYAAMIKAIPRRGTSREQPFYAQSKSLP